jgi:hypothetical protein
MARRLAYAIACSPLRNSNMQRNEEEQDGLSWRLKVFTLLVRTLRVPVGVAIALAGRLGVRYARLLSLRSIATRAFERGDHENSAGSPQLNSFGPNMTLARELLGSGQTAPVREYFALCRRFWIPQFADPKLKEWDPDVVAGREPRFGPHLRY